MVENVEELRSERAVSLSRDFQPLVTDKSKLRMPESRKLLRGDVPKVPKAGGIKTE